MTTEPGHIASVIERTLRAVQHRDPDYTLHWRQSVPVLRVGRLMITWEREHYFSGREVTMVIYSWGRQAGEQA